MRSTVREARLRGFGHVDRRDSECIGGRMLKVELGRWQRRKPKKRFMVVVRKDMQILLYESKSNLFSYCSTSPHEQEHCNSGELKPSISTVLGADPCLAGWPITSCVES